MVAHVIIVTAPVPQSPGFGVWVFGAGGLGTGLVNFLSQHRGSRGGSDVATLVSIYIKLFWSLH